MSALYFVFLNVKKKSIFKLLNDKKYLCFSKNHFSENLNNHNYNENPNEKEEEDKTSLKASKNRKFTDFSKFFIDENRKKSAKITEEEKKLYEEVIKSEEDVKNQEKKLHDLRAQRRLNQQRNFISQRKNLILNVKRELEYFKLDENFKLDVLRKKYLFFAKLYHPDSVKNDENSSENFNALRNNYEKLKVFCEMRDNLIESEKNIDDDGNIKIEQHQFDWPNEISQPEKYEIIKDLLLQNNFGDVKEPKNLMGKLFFLWFFIGSLVFFIEYKKFYRRYSIKRENVDYRKNYSEFLL